MDPLRFLPVARALAAMSKDPSTKVGAIILADDGDVISVGFNGFPRGVFDDKSRYQDRPTKLKLIAHAESNAIAQAARKGVSIKGSTLLVTALYPCTNCAKQVIQSGIRRVLAPAVHAPHTNEEWREERRISEWMFAEAGIQIVEYKEE